MNATRLLEKLEARRESGRMYPFVLRSSPRGKSMHLVFFSTPTPTPEQIAKKLEEWERILAPVHQETMERLKKDIKASCI